jgi:hypothetical protein
VSFEHHRRKLIIPADQVIISPTRRPLSFKFKCNNGLKMSVGYKNYNIKLKPKFTKTSTKSSTKPSTKIIQEKINMYINTDTMRKQRPIGFDLSSSCYYGSPEYFPDQISYDTKDKQYSFVNYHGSCDILHKFYFNLTKKYMNYFWKNTKKHYDLFDDNGERIYIEDQFEKQELQKISNQLNKRITRRGKYLNIDYKPFLIKFQDDDKKFERRDRELLQKKIFQAEILLKMWSKKQRVKKPKIKKVSIKPSAPSYNPEIELKSKENYNSSFFKQPKKAKSKKNISPKRSLVSINNSFNINVQCNIL